MPFGIAIEHYESDGAREVSFPLGVRRIGDEAFRGCDDLEDVAVPEGVCEIGAYAFSACLNLRRVSLP